MPRFQGLGHQIGLSAGVLQYGRSSPDGVVGLSRLGSAPFGYDERHEGLEGREEGGEADNVRVGEEVVEEALDVFARFGPAQVEQEDAYFGIFDLGGGQRRCLDCGAVVDVIECCCCVYSGPLSAAAAGDDHVM